MNYSIIRYILGCVFNFEAVFLVLPCVVSVIYKEAEGFDYLIALLISLTIGILLTRKKPKSSVFYTREGFVAVALSWLAMSVIGALPFVISGDIPRFTDALFEIISGFTTTGGSILTNVEALSYTSLFWRSFSNWIGGMGVLVFILAIMPLAGGSNMHLMRAESPGPYVGKLVPRVRSTAMILYGIYVSMTIAQIFLLLISKIPLFDAVTLSFSTAGTGGFAVKNTSLSDYAWYVQLNVTIFMFLFGVNFNVYYLLLIKKIKAAFAIEELRYYTGIVLLCVFIIAINIKDTFKSFLEALHHSAFQVSSIITTTGFSSMDFNTWPELSRSILVVLMFVGACAGSTGGGIKVSRLIVLVKTIGHEISRCIHPRSIKIIKMDGKKVEDQVIKSINVYLISYLLIFAVSVIIVSLDNFDLITNFTAVAATFNNIGPGLGLAGPTGSFFMFSDLSKFVMMFDMIAGRLEIIPILVLFAPATWKK